ncbi:MAG: ABC transporter substrate-binding protein, partial [Candidatus Marsarchaeota archaeon]|nr:ABC transporter substrate-binding protein [Candidatus Marsarchaeota archaeon]
MRLVNGLRTKLSVLAVLGICGLLAMGSVTPLVQAQSAPLPPFSIYGTPTPPFNAATAANTGEYWGPYVNTIYLTWFTTSEAIIEALVNGYIQYDSAGVSNAQQYNQLLQYEKTGLVAMNLTPSTDTFGYIGFAIHSYPFNNVHFRRGVQHLMNYQELASVLDNDILGIASPYFLIPQLYGSLAGTAMVQAYQKYGAYNLTAAKIEFEKAGLIDNPAGYWTYPNGTKVDIPIYYSTGTGQSLEIQELSIITQNAASINMTMHLVGVSFDTLAYTLLPTNAADIYTLGWIGLGAPSNPSWLWYIFGPAGLNQYFNDNISPPASNWTLLNEMLLDSTNQAQLVKNTNAAAAYLQSWVPYVVLDWGTLISPVNVKAWHGYTVEGNFGVLFPADIHPVNATFGTLYRYGMPDPPVDLNPYTNEDLYSSEVWGLTTPSAATTSITNPSGIAPLSAYNWTVKISSGAMPNGHAYNGSVITFKFQPGQYWSDGAPLTALDYNFSLWYYDVGGFSTNPYNPSSSMVTVAPGLTLNYSQVTQYPSFDYYGSAPGFVGSYVPANNPYEVTLYFNTSSVFNFLNVYGIPILPEHTLAHLSEAKYATDSIQQYLPYEPFGNEYMIHSWALSEVYADVVYNPSYFLANPYTNQISASAGSTATL